jgi:hypothetical protein
MFESYNDIKSCPQKITGILFFCKSWRKITGNEHFGYKNNNKALSFIPSTRQIALFSLLSFPRFPPALIWDWKSILFCPKIMAKNQNLDLARSQTVHGLAS